MSAPSLQYSHAQGRARRWLHRDLRNATIDGLFYTIMTGLVDWTLPVFVLWILARHPDRDAAAGLILTVPIAIGCVVGLATPLIVRRLGGYRIITAIYASSQAIFCVPLALLAISGTSSPGLLFLLATLYTIGAYAGGSSWATWSGCFTPSAVRTHYTARRNLILHVGLLAGVCFSGGLLYLANKASIGEGSMPALLGSRDQVMGRAFAAIFILGAIARVLSTYFMVQVPDARRFAKQERGLKTSELIHRLRSTSAGRFILFAAAAQFSLQLASSHWHSFTKAFLAYDYAQYFTLHASLFAGKILFNYFAGTISSRIGARRTGILAMFILAPVPILWLTLGQYFPLMLLTQLIAGAGLATLELAIYLLQLDTTHPQERTSLISKLLLTNNGSGLTGSAAGSQLLLLAPGLAGYAAIFISAALLRFTTSAILRRPPQEP